MLRQHIWGKNTNLSGQGHRLVVRICVAGVHPRTSKAITDPLLPQTPFALDTQKIKPTFDALGGPGC